VIKELGGTRISENIAIFGDVSIEQAKTILSEEKWKNTNIEVGVDSGQCGIFQDSKYPEGDTGEWGEKDSFYGKCCELTLGNENGGVLDFGIVSSSGYGDGSYDCLIFSSNDKISAIRIIFISDENIEDEDED